MGFFYPSALRTQIAPTDRRATNTVSTLYKQAMVRNHVQRISVVKSELSFRCHDARNFQEAFE